MQKQIVIIQGHPDPEQAHYCHAMAEAYAAGASSAGHEVATIPVAELDFPFLRGKADWDKGDVPPAIRKAQDKIRDANHLVIIYPLWLGTMPALLKAFFEQVLRPGFAMSFDDKGRWKRHLKGRSARVIITMGMPALAYRWFFRAHSLKSLERNILKFVGIKPVRETLIGMIENMSPRKREQWLQRLTALGKVGA